jgi:hypothetical protein
MTAVKVRLIFGLVVAAFSLQWLPGALGIAQASDSIGEVPDSRQPMGLNLPPYRMDAPGVPLDAEIVDDLEMLGVKWVRLEFQATGSPPAVPITDYQTVVDRLDARGIDVLGLLDYTTVPRPQDSWSQTTYRDEFIHSASLLVDEFRDKIRAWEIWNEQDIGFGPSSLGGDTYMSPQAYAYLLGGDPTADPILLPYAALGVYEAIKTSDPDAIVLLGGLSNAWKSPDGRGAGNYLLAVYQELSTLGYGPGSWPFDVVAVHPYYGLNPDPSVYLFNGGDYILRANIWAAMDEQGDGGKRIWVTEIGWNTNTTQWACMPPFVSEENQAAYLQESWDTFLRVPTSQTDVLVDKVFWYQYQDTGVQVDSEQCPVATATAVAEVIAETHSRVRPPRVTATPSSANSPQDLVVIDAWWGLVHGDLVPKPAFETYRDHWLPENYVYLPLIIRQAIFQ